MDRPQLEFGEGILGEALNSLDSYLLVTTEEPFEVLNKRLTCKPKHVLFNRDTSVENLNWLESDRKQVDYIVGLGGGTACDTAKYLSWKWNVPLIISPAILSVDAWLCGPIAVRENYKLRYVGSSKPERILLDFSLIQSAPKNLNRAGIGDIMSIASALGDWKIGEEKFGETLDPEIFKKARDVVAELMGQGKNINEVNQDGLRALVYGFLDEVTLCEQWGNARPEEGGEHFLAYCLEAITHDSYIHGNLVCLNVLVVLKLQREVAVYDFKTVKAFFDECGVDYSPQGQRIKRDDYMKALTSIRAYVEKDNLARGLWSLDKVFDDSGEYSVEGMLDWVYSFS